MNRIRDILKNVAVGILLATAANCLRYLVGPHIGSRGPFMFQLLAVAVAAQISGAAAGILATGLGALLINHYAPASDLYMREALTIFTVVGAAVSIFGEWRKRVEDDRRKALAELQRAQEQLALKHDVARMGAFDWYVREGYVRWTPEMERIYGVHHPEHVCTLAEWQSRVHPDDLADTEAVLADVAARRLPACDHSFRIIRSDGEVRWIHSRRKYQYDSEGQPIHVMGISMDITELREGQMAKEILGGLVHVCSACRRIREKSSDEWYSMEAYLRRHSSARFSHGMCPDCSKQWMAEVS